MAQELEALLARIRWALCRRHGSVEAAVDAMLSRSSRSTGGELEGAFYALVEAGADCNDVKALLEAAMTVAGGEVGLEHMAAVVAPDHLFPMPAEVRYSDG
ncbi:unnamed protein product [Symbiodinium natans]|uniref:Uncharacterized protein n=1 Tax=Symbiodinium natans TaxID=878477 RepID=A0A812V8E1_9DINO|nr:unnamed protein product [Symbiodinium natans]